MPAIEPLCSLMGASCSTLTKEEITLLEMEIFATICKELEEIFSESYGNYFRLMKFNIEKESVVLEGKLIQLIIEDILSTNEYNLQGIALYTNTHKDVVEEVMTGRNINPSAIFFRRLIDLHRSVRRNLYDKILEKLQQK